MENLGEFLSKIPVFELPPARRPLVRKSRLDLLSLISSRQHVKSNIVHRFPDSLFLECNLLGIATLQTGKISPRVQSFVKVRGIVAYEIFI